MEDHELDPQRNRPKQWLRLWLILTGVLWILWIIALLLRWWILPAGVIELVILLAMFALAGLVLTIAIRIITALALKIRKGWSKEKLLRTAFWLIPMIAVSAVVSAIVWYYTGCDLLRVFFSFVAIGLAIKVTIQLFRKKDYTASTKRFVAFTLWAFMVIPLLILWIVGMEEYKLVTSPASIRRYGEAIMYMCEGDSGERTDVSTGEHLRRVLLLSGAKIHPWQRKLPQEYQASDADTTDLVVCLSSEEWVELEGCTYHRFADTVQVQRLQHQLSVQIYDVVSGTLLEDRIITGPRPQSCPSTYEFLKGAERDAWYGDKVTLSQLLEEVVSEYLTP